MSTPASVQQIKSIKPHPTADKLDIIEVLGWQCVTGKGNFKDKDLVVYIEIDSVADPKPQFEFLKDRHYRIKTIKLRGELSQGLCLPISDFPEIPDTCGIGDDVSEYVGVKHYEKPIPTSLAGELKGWFPSFISKTDEERIQNIPDVIQELSGKPYYITVKCDGTSCTTYIKDGELNVCGRNFNIRENENNVYWKAICRNDIEKKLQRMGNFCLQGEVVGHGIQKNRLGLPEIDFLIFNIFDIDKGQFLSFDLFKRTIKQFELKSVPIMEEGESFGYTVEDLLKKAEGFYEGTKNNREGIVVRSKEETYSHITRRRLSFKVINNQYLLGDEE
jgi:RNA ligase (TIGR02306 family)